MAWEEESIESGADFEEVGGGKGKIKLIIIVLVVLGLGFGLWKFKDKLFGGDDEPTTEEGKDGEKAAKGGDDDAGDDDDDGGDGEESAAGFRVNLQKFTINLSGGGTSHFLVTTIVLEVSTEELKLSMEDPEDKDLAMIKTRDVINNWLRQKKYADMREEGATKEISKEIKLKLNRVLRKGKVLNVYFSEFLVD